MSTRRTRSSQRRRAARKPSWMAEDDARVLPDRPLAEAAILSSAAAGRPDESGEHSDTHRGDNPGGCGRRDCHEQADADDYVSESQKSPHNLTTPVWSLSSFVVIAERIGLMTTSARQETLKVSSSSRSQV